MTVAVLGGGLAGLAAAQRLVQRGVNAIVYEREDSVGGHARSHAIDGFTFDEGPHVSFTTDAAVQALLADAVAGRFLEHSAKLLNYSRGALITHPVQCNLRQLPPRVGAACLADFVAAQHTQPPPPASFADWCRATFGRRFADDFPLRYCRKYWTVDGEALAADWMGGRIRVPTIAEAIAGAFHEPTEAGHYITRFRYPEAGGFGAYCSAFAKGVTIRTGSEVVAVDPCRRRLTLADGRTEYFDGLISSLPMPTLVELLADVPERIRAAGRALACSSVALVNLMLDQDAGLPPAHWMYFYDEDIVFSRIHFPHRLAPANAPAGRASLQAEIYHSRFRPLPCADLIGRTIADLRRSGVLRPDVEILGGHISHAPFANVIFDRQRAGAVAAVREFLADLSIQACGRYGEWEYYWTDGSIHSGWRAASRILAARGVEPRPLLDSARSET